MKVIVSIPAFSDDVIPIVFELQDDNIVEDTNIYELTIVNISDPTVVVGDVNITYIVVQDDDDDELPVGKI